MIRTRITVAAFLALLALPLFAQSANTSLYTVKFVCGFTDGRVPRLNDPSPLPAPYRAVEPGNYGTVINLKNVTLMDFETVSVSRSVQVRGLTTGHGLGFGSISLPPGEVSTIDCTDITTRLSQPPGTFVNDGRFVEGYVTLSTDLYDPAILQLDVTAAYTYAIQKADNAGTGLGSSLQIVTIPPRNVFQPE